MGSYIEFPKMPLPEEPSSESSTKQQPSSGGLLAFLRNLIDSFTNWKTSFWSSKESKEVRHALLQACKNIKTLTAEQQRTAIKHIHQKSSYPEGFLGVFQNALPADQELILYGLYKDPTNTIDQLQHEFGQDLKADLFFARESEKTNPIELNVHVPPPPAGKERDRQVHALLRQICNKADLTPEQRRAIISTIPKVHSCSSDLLRLLPNLSEPNQRLILHGLDKYPEEIVLKLQLGLDPAFRAKLSQSLVQEALTTRVNTALTLSTEAKQRIIKKINLLSKDLCSALTALPNDTYTSPLNQLGRDLVNEAENTLAILTAKLARKKGLIHSSVQDQLQSCVKSMRQLSTSEGALAKQRITSLGEDFCVQLNTLPNFKNDAFQQLIVTTLIQDPEHLDSLLDDEIACRRLMSSSISLERQADSKLQWGLDDAFGKKLSHSPIQDQLKTHIDLSFGLSSADQLQQEYVNKERDQQVHALLRQICNKADLTSEQRRAIISTIPKVHSCSADLLRLLPNLSEPNQRLILHGLDKYPEEIVLKLQLGLNPAFRAKLSQSLVQEALTTRVNTAPTLSTEAKQRIIEKINLLSEDLCSALTELPDDTYKLLLDQCESDLVTMIEGKSTFTIEGTSTSTMQLTDQKTMLIYSSVQDQLKSCVKSMPQLSASDRALAKTQITSLDKDFCIQLNTLPNFKHDAFKQLIVIALIQEPERLHFLLDDEIACRRLMSSSISLERQADETIDQQVRAFLLNMCEKATDLTEEQQCTITENINQVTACSADLPLVLLNITKTNQRLILYGLYRYPEETISKLQWGLDNAFRKKLSQSLIQNQLRTHINKLPENLQQTAATQIDRLNQECCFQLTELSDGSQLLQEQFVRHLATNPKQVIIFLDTLFSDQKTESQIAVQLKLTEIAQQTSILSPSDQQHAVARIALLDKNFCYELHALPDFDHPNFLEKVVIALVETPERLHSLLADEIACRRLMSQSLGVAIGVAISVDQRVRDLLLTFDFGIYSTHKYRTAITKNIQQLNACSAELLVTLPKLSSAEQQLIVHGLYQHPKETLSKLQLGIVDEAFIKKMSQSFVQDQLKARVKEIEDMPGAHATAQINRLDEDYCYKLMNLPYFSDLDFQDEIVMWLTLKLKTFKPSIDEAEFNKEVAHKHVRGLFKNLITRIGRPTLSESEYQAAPRHIRQLTKEFCLKLHGLNVFDDPQFQKEVAMECAKNSTTILNLNLNFESCMSQLAVRSLLKARIAGIPGFSKEQKKQALTAVTALTTVTLETTLNATLCANLMPDFTQDAALQQELAMALVRNPDYIDTLTPTDIETLKTEKLPFRKNLSQQLVQHILRDHNTTLSPEAKQLIDTVNEDLCFKLITQQSLLQEKELQKTIASGFVQNPTETLAILNRDDLTHAQRIDLLTLIPLLKQKLSQAAYLQEEQKEVLLNAHLKESALSDVFSLYSSQLIQQLQNDPLKATLLIFGILSYPSQTMKSLFVSDEELFRDKFKESAFFKQLTKLQATQNAPLVEAINHTLHQALSDEAKHYLSLLLQTNPQLVKAFVKLLNAASIPDRTEEATLAASKAMRDSTHSLSNQESRWIHSLSDVLLNNAHITQSQMLEHCVTDMLSSQELPSKAPPILFNSYRGITYTPLNTSLQDHQFSIQLGKTSVALAFPPFFATPIDSRTPQIDDTIALQLLQQALIGSTKSEFAQYASQLLGQTSLTQEEEESFETLRMQLNRWQDSTYDIIQDQLATTEAKRIEDEGTDETVFLADITHGMLRDTTTTIFAIIRMINKTKSMSQKSQDKLYRLLQASPNLVPQFTYDATHLSTGESACLAQDIDEMIESARDLADLNRPMTVRMINDKMHHQMSQQSQNKLYHLLQASPNLVPQFAYDATHLSTKESAYLEQDIDKMIESVHDLADLNRLMTVRMINDKMHHQMSLQAQDKLDRLLQASPNLVPQFAYDATHLSTEESAYLAQDIDEMIESVHDLADLNRLMTVRMINDKMHHQMSLQVQNKLCALLQGVPALDQPFILYAKNPSMESYQKLVPKIIELTPTWSDEDRRWLLDTATELLARKQPFTDIIDFTIGYLALLRKMIDIGARGSRTPNLLAAHAEFGLIWQQQYTPPEENRISILLAEPSGETLRINLSIPDWTATANGMRIFYKGVTGGNLASFTQSIKTLLLEGQNSKQLFDEIQEWKQTTESQLQRAIDEIQRPVPEAALNTAEFLNNFEQERIYLRHDDRLSLSPAPLKEEAQRFLKTMLPSVGGEDLTIIDRHVLNAVIQALVISPGSTQEHETLDRTIEEGGIVYKEEVVEIENGIKFYKLSSTDKDGKELLVSYLHHTKPDLLPLWIEKHLLRTRSILLSQAISSDHG